MFRLLLQTSSEVTLSSGFLSYAFTQLGIILRSDLSWTNQVNYTVKKAWRALHFTMRILKKGNSNTKSLADRKSVV
jgi:tellurite resistance protein TehA-like permease